MVAIFVKTAAIAGAVLAATTEAHNKMTLPLPTWPDGFYAQNSPSGTIDPATVLPVPSGMSYNTDSASNTEAYWTAFNASTYKSLKELAWDSQTLADGASNECGFSVVDGTAQDLPAENWNCAVDYPETPANLPYDKAKCASSSVLTSYWIALHTTPWQVYTNCAPLTGGSASTNSSTSTTTSSSSDTTETTPVATTKTPSTTTSTKTSAPVATTATKTSAPAATTATPTATTAAQTTITSTEASAEEGSSTSDEASTDAEAETEAPAPSTDKCSVRRRRH
ncbi:uncharacterized protein KRP23_14908 [Phytophthora ramorum]|uniref:uncharacterized protein n=1 Tax=Phytophthora ramorum TaxID=164328 RepID=UPI0030B67DBB|nr:hypothetical protein KRP23_14908 [Phytophthora ramorum]